MTIRHRFGGTLLAALATFCFGNAYIETAFGAAPLEYHAAEPGAAKPLPAKGPTTREETEAFIDGFMAAKVKQNHVAGATVAVVKDGALFFAKGYGWADVEKRIPVDAEKTMFRPGSVSKLFTWTAVMQLVEQGKLNLDTDVNRYLQDVKVPQTYPQPITLRNIMTHTAGFEDGGVGYLFASKQQDIIPLHDWLAKHMPARVNPPVQDFSQSYTASYSNYATALAGHIVATVSGMPYDDYIEQHIFKPLQMTSSTFREPLSPSLAPNMSVGYNAENGAFEPKPFELIHAVGPAGALSSTATDMARFIAAYLQGGALGEGRILKPETVAMMHTRTMSRDPSLAGHALGFYETYVNGHRILGHGGDTLYFHSALSLLPEANLGLFVSINTGGDAARTSEDLERAFYQHYFPAELPKLKIRSDAKERNARYAGNYRTLRRSYTAWEKALTLGGDDKVTAMPDGTLLYSFIGEPARWIEVSDGVFRAANDDDYIAFKGDEGGKAKYLVTSFPSISSERIGFFGSSLVHFIIVGVSLLLFISIIVSAIRQRRVDRAAPASVRWARPVLALTAVLLILFVVTMALVFAAGIDNLIFHVPSTLYLALAFPLLALIPAIAAVYFTYVIWKSGAWRLRTRLFYTLTTLAVLSLLWSLNYWNLLGYRFN